jgi:hypothetical protein
MEAQKRGALVTLFESSVWEFPIAFQKWMLGVGSSNEVEESLLKSCQAWVDLANQSIDRMFQAEGFVGLMTTSVQYFVQSQRITRDLLTSLTPSGARGNGSAGNVDEIKQLHESVAGLRREVRGLTARINLIDRTPRQSGEAEVQASEVRGN